MSLLADLFADLISETMFEGIFRSPRFRYIVGSIVGLIGFVLLYSAFVTGPLTPADATNRNVMLWVGVLAVVAGGVLILWAKYQKKA